MATPALASSPAPSGATSGGNLGSGEAGGDGFAGDPAFDAGGSGDDAGPAGADGDGAGDPQAGQAPSPFRFGQREWPSQERAEREFLTNVGRLQAAQRRQAELEQQIADMRTAMQRGGAPPGADQGEPGAGGEADAEDAPLLDIDSLDWQLISGAFRERGPEVGMYLLAKAMVEGIGGGLKGRMSKALEPLNGLREAATVSAKTARLWQGAADAVGEDGSLLFPELSSPNEAQMVHDLWRQITDGMPPDVANHPRMVRSAVLEYRLARGTLGNNQGAGDGAGDAAGVAAEAVEAMRGAATSVGDLPTARTQTQPRQARQKPMTEEERIRQSLLTGGQERGALGFRR